MSDKIKMVAVDIDGTFVRSDYTYDIPRFQRILSHMKSIGWICFRDIMMNYRLWQKTVHL